MHFLRPLPRLALRASSTSTLRALRCVRPLPTTHRSFSTVDTDDDAIRKIVMQSVRRELSSALAKTLTGLGYNAAVMPNHEELLALKLPGFDGENYLARAYPTYVSVGAIYGVRDAPTARVDKLCSDWNAERQFARAFRRAEGNKRDVMTLQLQSELLLNVGADHEFVGRDHSAADTALIDSWLKTYMQNLREFEKGVRALAEEAGSDDE